MHASNPLADLPRLPCSIAASLELVGERWALLVVRGVSLGNHRFSEIARGTGAARDRLSARLCALVAASVLEKRPYSDAPPVELHHSSGAHADHVVDAEWACRTCGEPVNASRVQRVLTPAGRALSGLPTDEDDDDDR